MASKKNQGGGSSKNQLLREQGWADQKAKWEGKFNTVPLPDAPYGVWGQYNVVDVDGTPTLKNTLNPRVEAFIDKTLAGDDTYSKALLSNALRMLEPEMAARGLPEGSEINDTARLNAAIQAQLGGAQQQASERQQAMQLAEQIYQSQVLPYLKQIERENLIYGNKMAGYRQDAANEASNKSSKSNAATTLGSAII